MLDDLVLDLWYVLLGYDLNWFTVRAVPGQVVLANTEKNMLVIASTTVEALELAIEREKEYATHRR